MKGESVTPDGFVIGESYSRKDIAQTGGVTAPSDPRDPNWASGIVEFDNAVLLLVTLIKPEAYRDYFEGALFWWQSQKRQSGKSRIIQQLGNGELPAYLFVRMQAKRAGKTQSFVYCGALSAPELEGQHPVTGLFAVLDYAPNATGALGDIYAWRPDSPATADEIARHSSLAKRRPARGQGRQMDPELRRALELYAMQHATNHYKAAGYEVQDTSSNRPYDLVCTSPSDHRRVEVKGTQSAGTAVRLTAGEVRAARDATTLTDLYVVHSITIGPGPDSVLTNGTVKLIENWIPEDEDLVPTEFNYCLPTE